MSNRFKFLLLLLPIILIVSAGMKYSKSRGKIMAEKAKLTIKSSAFEQTHINNIVAGPAA